MADIMLVAGRDTQSLKSYFEDRGTTNVLESYSSLYENSDKLLNAIYHVEKLVYVNSESTTTIRKDLQTLKDMIVGGVFFKLNEVIFVSTTKVIASEKDDYFTAFTAEMRRQESVRRGLLLPDFNVYIVPESDYTMGYVYDALLGRTEELSIDNTYDVVYRTEIDSDSNTAYEAEDNSSLVIEPFNYRNHKLYEEMQSRAIKTESTEAIRDSLESSIPKTDPYLPQIPIPVSTIPNTILVTGLRKSGVSTIATVFTLSLLAKNKKILLVSLAKHDVVYDYLASTGVMFNEIKSEDLLHNTVRSFGEGISILKGIPRLSAGHMMRFISSNLENYDLDFVVVDCHEDLVSKVLPVLPQNTRVYLISRNNGRDLMETSEIVPSSKGMSLILNDPFTSPIGLPELPPSEIRDIFPDVREIFGRMPFTEFPTDGYISENILGVR